eukprot:scaffold19690_cov114-Isochrysis_galbana.AAC.2
MPIPRAREAAAPAAIHPSGFQKAAAANAASPPTAASAPSRATLSPTTSAPSTPSSIPSTVAAAAGATSNADVASPMDWATAT